MDNHWNKDELTFVDSWKDKNVELAAGTAIIVGAGLFGAKGKMPEVTKYGKQAVGHAGKAFDKYVKKNSHPVIKNGYVLGSTVYKNMKNAKIPNKQEVFDEYMATNKSRMSRVDEKTLDTTFNKTYGEALDKYHAKMDLAKGLGKEPPNIKAPDPVLIREQVRQNLVEQVDELPIERTGQPKPVPLFNKRDVAANLVGSSVSAVGFGAGLTAFHAGNNLLFEKDKERDKTFVAAGSFIDDKKKKERREMNKQAGSREIYDSIATVADTVPKAIGTGLGFTGVSLGAAHLLNKNKPEESNKNRIIIELGEDDPMNKSNSSHATAGGLNMLPKPEFNKSAGFNSFLKNMGGRKSEINALDRKMKNNDYVSDASNSLKSENVDELASGRFGHLLNSEKSKEKLLDSQAAQLKNQDFQAQEAIKNEVAKTRLAGMGGLGIAGLAGAAAHSRNKGAETNEQDFV